MEIQLKLFDIDVDDSCPDENCIFDEEFIF